MQPILVTGVPRSGTTWLARLLARSPGTALAGREPMNPRGRQYALGGTLTGWARLGSLTPRQRLLLRAAYRGWNPMVYSRYGARQWAAALPTTRVVVKDPYALLSLPVVHAATGAVPVVVYRHPGAVLASYRRVGWSPRTDEVAAIAAVEGLGGRLSEEPVGAGPITAERMGEFWSVLHELVLADLTASGAVLVSHAELAAGGADAGRALADHLGLAWTSAMADELTKESAAAPVAAAHVLHHFDRSPRSVAEEWRGHLAEGEVEAVERVGAETLARVEAARLRLG